MDYKHNIRNMSVIAHVDHGIKSSYPLFAFFLLLACRIMGSSCDSSHVILAVQFPFRSVYSICLWRLENVIFRILQAIGC